MIARSAPDSYRDQARPTLQKRFMIARSAPDSYRDQARPTLQKPDSVH
ncbi:MAG: hypothetical protein R2795_01520 [Saprospiraceae bacterium]